MGGTKTRRDTIVSLLSKHLGVYVHYIDNRILVMFTDPEVYYTLDEEDRDLIGEDLNNFLTLMGNELNLDILFHPFIGLTNDLFNRSKLKFEIEHRLLLKCVDKGIPPEQYLLKRFLDFMNGTDTGQMTLYTLGVDTYTHLTIAPYHYLHGRIETIVGSDIIQYDRRFLNINDIDVEGEHKIKVQDIKTGEVYNCIHLVWNSRLGYKGLIVKEGDKEAYLDAKTKFDEKRTFI